MRDGDDSDGMQRPALLCLSQSFSPQTTPTAIRASKLVRELASRWNVTVLTETRQDQIKQAESVRVRVRAIPGRRPRRLLRTLRRLRLSKLIELAVWPDDSIFWVIPAVMAGRRLIRERAPEAIVVFMMPYSAGLAGVLLSKLTGIALVLNLDDSPTCTDMHPYHPTRLHYRLAKALEDFYVRRGDEIVYVSQRNLDAVAARQPDEARAKLHLVRYGADPADFGPGESAAARASAADGNGHAHATGAGSFEVAYVGAMSGWWALIGEQPPTSRARRLYAAWTRLGRYERAALDPRTSSPAIAGKAILDLLAERPDWTERIRLMIYGNPYDPAVVTRALARAGVEEVVTVLDPVPHAEVAAIVRGADLLFITLPNRLDGSPGGRISAKTYEYLMTDRPILAAVPPGESWDYLEGKPGVWLVRPDDREGIGAVIAELAQAKFAGRQVSFDRERLRDELSYETRAERFAEIIEAATASRRDRPPRSPR